MQYWLMKSEPDEVSIDDALAAAGRITPWFGVRNYQARNFMRDRMQIGDGVLFYHSSCAQPGIYGIAAIASAAYPDPTQFQPASHYYDPKSAPQEPRWLQIDVRAHCKAGPLLLSEMRAMPQLEGMLVLQKASRLSITPVAPEHWQAVLQHLHLDPGLLQK
ncbi:EVE domain-containing protein [Massilia sp. W12]|uniref:EVE domain-containing protein n=1 Tax=Massilia sp. W12 TaxID=3126507 RepID=UPI0030D48AA6